jgi:hypothetical protein
MSDATPSDVPHLADSRAQAKLLECLRQHREAAMRSPFVDSASFLSDGPHDSDGRELYRSGWLLAFALVIAVAASSAVLLAL